jgi:uncharacterized protein YndB with AHSA1/START domain
MMKRHKKEERPMAPIVSRVEIDRRPEDVFSYVTDASRLTEWQESLVSVRPENGGPAAVGSKIITTRRVGRGERTMTMEMTELSPPKTWAARGIDGPVRAIVNGTVEPLEEGARSRVTIELDFEGHGIGKLLVPLMVRRQAKDELPRNTQHIKERLEGQAA